ncbi:MAG: DUF2199 domain-containing protein [Acidimicrobiia bacterium]
MASPPARCPTCGRHRADHDRALRFGLPDRVLALPGLAPAIARSAEGTFLTVADVGSFVRVTVPVPMTGGYSVTFGAWLDVAPADFDRAARLWATPGYAGLTLAGVLANALPPWEAETYGRPLLTSVRDPAEVPVAIASDDPGMDRLLHHEWPHELVLAALMGSPRRRPVGGSGGFGP